VRIRSCGPPVGLTRLLLSYEKNFLMGNLSQVRQVSTHPQTVSRSRTMKIERNILKSRHQTTHVSSLWKCTCILN